MITIEVKVGGVTDLMQRILAGLEDRTVLHARMASKTELLAVDYVSKLDRHATARELGAKPSDHLAKAAKGIESVSDNDGATLRFPRASRLRAAFGDFTIRPKNGSKYLTIPASAKTYGKRVGEIQEPLHFQMIKERYKALCFKDGTVAYWLRAEVTIKEDRSLLPFDQIKALAQRIARDYIHELANQDGGAA